MELVGETRTCHNVGWIPSNASRSLIVTELETHNLARILTTSTQDKVSVGTIHGITTYRS